MAGRHIHINIYLYIYMHVSTYAYICKAMKPEGLNDIANARVINIRMCGSATSI